MSDLAPANYRRLLLTEGGPTYRLELRVGLIRKNTPRTLRRALLSVLFTWVPLLALSALQGDAIGDLVPVPFLRDFAVHARFLFAVPLLLAAETVLGPRLAHAAGHFVESGLVTEVDFPRFEAAVEDGLRSRDSTRAELAVAILAYGVTATTLFSTAIHVSTWYAIRAGGGLSFTWSGWWYVLFCVPLFQFLVLRWLWRLFLWARFLWRMHELNLQLVPTHPDQAGGLAFVGESQRFFAMILFAHAVAVAGVLANGVFYDGFPLPHFAPAIGAYVFIAVAVILIPLASFTPLLLKTKRSGRYQYGTLATEYTTSFHEKWVIGPRPSEEALLGSGDIQSLADLGNSFAFVERMSALPVGPRTPIHLALACLLPISPLLLTMMPLEAVLKMIFKVVL